MSPKYTLNHYYLVLYIKEDGAVISVCREDLHQYRCFQEACEVAYHELSFAHKISSQTISVSGQITKICLQRIVIYLIIKLSFFVLCSKTRADPKTCFFSSHSSPDTYLCVFVAKNFFWEFFYSLYSYETHLPLF